MLATTFLMFLGTVISVVMALDFMRPLRNSHPF